ncbi:hypothetical protein LCD52_00115 [Rossellomorea vietnamensis]|uniref:hypothetical protein n=1 Tax=Rossellomorea vietnamensis TaxID=218284 RepID=UPI001CCE47C3|nr:hypothetical protein [Rossellomorea vietnamensis]MCA0147182.1 hypothetical protein [Rossellomorea vietnamensis]
MKFLKLVPYFVTALFLITGCQSSDNADIEVKMKSNEELKEIADTYTYEDYKRVLEEAVAEADEFEKDGKLNKWIIRTLAQEKLNYKTDLAAEQVIKLAEKSLEEDKVWKSIAEDKYGITVTEAEVDKYIKDGPDTFDLPQMRAYANVLGLSLEELNHNFDRDIYEKNVIWLKLKPDLEKKYGITDNNKQVEKYEEEVEKQL